MFQSFITGLVGVAGIAGNIYSDQLALEMQAQQTAAVQAQTAAQTQRQNSNLVLYFGLGLLAFVVVKKMT